MPHEISPESSPSGDVALADIVSSQPADDKPIKSDADGAATTVNVEDIFCTDDEDEEFPSSAVVGPSANEPPSSPPVAVPNGVSQSTDYSDPEIMVAYYSRLFPWRSMFQWLNHSMKPCNDFANREFAFTLSNDAYLRYQSFPTADALRKDVLRLNPSRFEIGPVYNANPRDRKSLKSSSKFRPVAKELVFDIDLTDYDEIRTCCTGANICNKCWQWSTMAIKVVDAALREDFGFKHIIWIYSGRRGVHAWISDKRARDMDDNKRKALAGYLELIKGGSQSGKKVNVKRPLHPHLVRSLEILRGHFLKDVIEGQDPWRSDDGAQKLLSLLPDKDLCDALRKKWDSSPGRSSSSKWADIDALAKAGASKNLDTKALLEAKKDVLLEYTYPRLDVEVSKRLIHLLKAPFVIHPKTGRVCVPIDINKVEQFDPMTVPKVTDLLQQIDDYRDEDSAMTGDDNDRAVQDYEKTALREYVDIFKDHVSEILKTERGVKREREEGDPMEF